MKISTTDGGAAQAELSRGTVNSLLLAPAEITVAPVTHLTSSEKLPPEVLCACAMVAALPFGGWEVSEISLDAQESKAEKN